MTLKIRLIPDDYHLPDVGKLENGAMYWIDIQLSSEGRNTRDFVATYIFDLNGYLIWNEIEDLGLRSDIDIRDPETVIAEHKAKIGKGQTTDIWVHPFSVEEHGLTFGLMVRKREDDESNNSQEDEEPMVDALPGFTLLFYPPWEEGHYDT